MNCTTARDCARACKNMQSKHKSYLHVYLYHYYTNITCSLSYYVLYKVTYILPNLLRSLMFTVPFGELLNGSEFSPLLKDNTTHSKTRGNVEFNGPTVSSKVLLFRRAQGTVTPEPLIATVLSTGTRQTTM